jgi:hypothetical protein
MSSGCKECGARAVGEPLPKPAHELPSYGRSLVLAVTGSLAVLIFVVQTIAAFFQRAAGDWGFWSWVAAGETAAWRLKWVSIPILFVALWFGRKLYRSIRLQPERFCGLNYARRGLIATATVAILLAVLIGVTVPARLEHRRLANEAAIRVNGYVIEKALAEYKVQYQTYPADLNDLLVRLPDPDGSLAAALAAITPGSYVPTAEFAAVTTEKPRRVTIQKASFPLETDDTPTGGLAFTNYQFRLPGEDKITNTEDDWIVRDGMVMKQSDVAKGGVGSSVSAGALKP